MRNSTTLLRSVAKVIPPIVLFLAVIAVWEVTIDAFHVPIRDARVRIDGLRKQGHEGSWYGMRGGPSEARTDAQGRARMVDVSDKAETTRSATARGSIRMQPETAQLEHRHQRKMSAGRVARDDEIGRRCAGIQQPAIRGDRVFELSGMRMFRRQAIVERERARLRGSGAERVDVGKGRAQRLGAGRQQGRRIAAHLRQHAPARSVERLCDGAAQAAIGAEDQNGGSG